ncbi:MAG: hypothetical protein L3J37_07490 [Rhodobacteraceae bacterium]|nr:hypothetical protein [Paracoccaceae bacterium]
MKNLIFGSLATLSLIAIGTTAALAEAREAGPRGGMERPPFETLDTNGDGNLTLEEMQQKSEARFAELDTNDDGELGKAELLTQAMNRAGETITRMLENKDKDGNGTLSLEEMSPRDLGPIFERLDRDGSGDISLEEWETAKKGPKNNRGPHRSTQPDNG